MAQPTELFTHSRRTMFQRCHYEHHLRYEKHLRPVHTTEPMLAGTIVHAGLQAWYEAIRDNKAPLPLALRAIQEQQQPEISPYLIGRCEAMMVGYHFRWFDVATHWTILGVEQEFCRTLVNPTTGAKSRTFLLGGKLDVRIRDDAGVWVVEHKTTGRDISAGSAYTKRLLIDGQISTYVDGAGSLGDEIVGCIYDVLAVPGARPYKATPPESRKYTKDGRLYASQREEDESVQAYTERVANMIAEAPENFYQQVRVRRLANELDSHRADVWNTAQEMQLARRTGVHTKTPGACFRFESFCPYFDLCTGTTTEDDTSRFIQTRPHEELAADGPSLNAERGGNEQ